MYNVPLNFSYKGYRLYTIVLNVVIDKKLTTNIIISIIHVHVYIDMTDVPSLSLASDE